MRITESNLEDPMPGLTYLQIRPKPRNRVKGDRDGIRIRLLLANLSTQRRKRKGVKGDIASESTEIVIARVGRSHPRVLEAGSHLVIV